MGERESNHEQKSLQEQFIRLSDYIADSPIPKLQALDEYFVVATKYYQQKARQGEEDHEEAYQRAKYYEKLQNGKIQNKWEFVMIRRRTFVTLAQNLERKGYIELAAESHTKANNLRELAYAIRREQRNNR